MKINKNKVALLILALIVTSFILALSYLKVFDPYELETLDIRFRLRPVQKVNPDIVIIEIDDYSIEYLGKWPFPRKTHKLLVKALKENGARLIIFDIFFSEPTPEDEEFADSVKEAGNVYMPYVFDVMPGKDSGMLRAGSYAEDLLDVFKKSSKRTGFINIAPDIDGKFRHVPPFIEYRGELHKHMTFRASLDYIGVPEEALEFIPGKYIKLGTRGVIPLGERSDILVNFPGYWKDTFRHYAYVDIIQSYLSDITGDEPRVDLSRFKNAVCFIGVTATATPDVHPSPLEALYPGVGVHASLLNSIYYMKFLDRASKLVNILVLLILCIAAHIITSRSRTLLGMFLTFALILCYLIFETALFIFFGVWLDVFYPITVIIFLYIGLIFRKYILEMHTREVLEKELVIAKRIQESFLPREKPGVEGIQIAAQMSTAKQVGGDLYSFMDMGRDNVGIMIGDVSGKGIPAALYMAKVVSEFKIFANTSASSLCVLNLNNKLVAESGTNLFVTLSYLIFDMKKRTLNYASGGHLPIILVRKGEEKPQLLDAKEGMPLGLMEGGFSEETIAIEKGDTFVLYTDGVTEAVNKKGEMFGPDRLIDLVNKNRDVSVDDMVQLVQEEIAKFEGKGKQHDDITAVAVKVVG